MPSLLKCVILENECKMMSLCTVLCIWEASIFTDGALLIQPLANQAQSASARSKPHLVEKVAGV